MSRLKEELKLTDFKQTEAGIIPKDWKVSTVGREFEIKLGKMLDAEKNVGTLKPYLGNKSVQWNRIDLDESQMMAMTQADLKRFRLRQGDLLVCEGGEVGRAAIWDSPIEECYYQKALHRLRPLRKFNIKLFLEFLHFWVNHDMLANYVSQTSIAHLTREKFSEVPLPVPPLPEQQAIAEVLSDVDALITSLDQIIAKKRNIKQGAMQLLLTGKKRLAGFSGEWETKTLGEILTVKHGRSQEGISKANGKYPILATGGEIGRTDCVLYDKPSVLIGRKGTIDVPRYMETPFWTVDTLFYTEISAKAFAKYIFYKFNTIDWYLYNEASGVPSLNSKTIENIEIKLPPTKEEQKAIAQILSDMDAEIESLKNQRDKYKAVKQGMMQELLTGKTRLVKSDEQREIEKEKTARLKVLDELTAQAQELNMGY